MSTAKRLIEKSTGFTIERYGRRALTVFHKDRPLEAWFSLQAQMQSLLKERRIDLALDVGANKGQFGSRVRKIYDGQMISFEPVAGAYQMLSQVAASDPNWQTCKFALGDQQSIADINVYRNDEFSSLLAVNDYCHERFAEQTRTQSTERIEVRRLHDVIVERNLTRRNIFLKLDTQGFDIQAFRGATESLKQVHVLLSEISLIPIYDGAPRWTETVSVYEDAGFGIVGLFPINRDHGRIVEYDCLMART